MTIAPLTEERFDDFVGLIHALADYQSLARRDATTCTTTGVSLADVGGGVTIAGGSIANPAGTAFAMSGGDAGVTYGGSIAKTSASLAVDIQNRSGGSTTFGGTISQTGGSGIQIAGATAASPVTFNGAVTLGTTTTRNTGGLVVNNNGQTSIVAFNDGLSIATSGAAGVTASKGGTLTSQGAVPLDIPAEIDLSSILRPFLDRYEGGELVDCGGRRACRLARMEREGRFVQDMRSTQLLL